MEMNACRLVIAISNIMSVIWLTVVKQTLVLFFAPSTATSCRPHEVV